MPLEQLGIVFRKQFTLSHITLSFCSQSIQLWCPWLPRPGLNPSPNPKLQGQATHLCSKVEWRTQKSKSTRSLPCCKGPADSDKKSRVLNQTSDSQNCHPAVRENKVLMRTKHLSKDNNPKEHIYFEFLNLKLHLNSVKKNLRLSSCENSAMVLVFWIEMNLQAILLAAIRLLF